MSISYDRATQFFDGAVTLATGTYYSDTIPLKKLGVNINESLLRAQVTEAFTSGGAATVDFTLEKDTTSAFGSPVTVKTTGALAMATLVDNFEIFKQHLSDLAYREADADDTYLRVKMVVATAALTAGSWKGNIILSTPENNLGL